MTQKMTRHDYLVREELEDLADENTVWRETIETQRDHIATLTAERDALADMLKQAKEQAARLDLKRRLADLQELGYPDGSK